MDLASLFAGSASAVRSIFVIRHYVGTGPIIAEPFDQGFGPIGFCHPGLDILQPCQIGLAGVFSQDGFRVFSFPK